MENRTLTAIDVGEVMQMAEKAKRRLLDRLDANVK
jgi:hypothetical protein